MFVGAAGLALAQEGVNERVEGVGPLVAFDDQLLSAHAKGLDRVAAGMQDLAPGFESFGEPGEELSQGFRSGINMDMHGGRN